MRHLRLVNAADFMRCQYNRERHWTFTVTVKGAKNTAKERHVRHCRRERGNGGEENPELPRKALRGVVASGRVRCMGEAGATRTMSPSVAGGSCRGGPGRRRGDGESRAALTVSRYCSGERRSRASRPTVVAAGR